MIGVNSCDMQEAAGGRLLPRTVFQKGISKDQECSRQPSSWAGQEYCPHFGPSCLGMDRADHDEMRCPNTCNERKSQEKCTMWKKYVFPWERLWTGLIQGELGKVCLGTRLQGSVNNVEGICQLAVCGGHGVAFELLQGEPAIVACLAQARRRGPRSAPFEVL